LIANIELGNHIQVSIDRKKKLLKVYIPTSFWCGEQFPPSFMHILVFMERVVFSL